MKLRELLILVAVWSAILGCVGYGLGLYSEYRAQTRERAAAAEALAAAKPDTVYVRDTVFMAGPQLVKTIVKTVRDTVTVTTVEHVSAAIQIDRQQFEYTGEHFAAWVSGSVLDGSPETAPALDSIAVYPETKIVERRVTVTAPVDPRAQRLSIAAEALALTRAGKSGTVGAGIRATYSRGWGTASALVGYGWEVSPGVAPVGGPLIGGSIGIPLIQF